MAGAPDRLEQHRKEAADQSRGMSSNVIYETFLRIIRAKQFRGRVLDYGAGAGELTRLLLQSGSFEKVAAADLMAPPPDLANKIDWIQQDLNESIRERDGDFHLVVAAEVIEHLENPRSMIRDLFRLLRKGGTAILSTPNNESWRSILALLVRGHFAAFTDSSYPAHITALVRRDLTRIFAEAGFVGTQFHYTESGGLPGSPAVTWQQVSFGMLQGRRFSDNIIAIAEKPK